MSPTDGAAVSQIAKAHSVWGKFGGRNHQISVTSVDVEWGTAEDQRKLLKLGGF